MSPYMYLFSFFLISGYQHALFKQELWKELSPIVAALQQLVHIFCYGILFAVAFGILHYSIGVTVFHALQTRRLFPSQVVYTVPVVCADLDAAQSDEGTDGEGPFAGPATDAQSSNVATLTPPRNASKFPLHVRFTAKTKGSPEEKRSMPKLSLKDFHYSETKV